LNIEINWAKNKTYNMRSGIGVITLSSGSGWLPYAESWKEIILQSAMMGKSM